MGGVYESGAPPDVEAREEVGLGEKGVKRECVEDLDPILSTKGIDMVQFGPADYAMSIGVAGQWSHPEVLRAERKAIETALKKGIHPRVELSNPKDAAQYREMGVKHFCIGWDAAILHDWWRDNGRKMRDLIGGERRG